MKSYLVTLFLCVVSLCSAGPLQDRHLDLDRVKFLVEVLGGDGEADLIEETQRSWLRPKGKERWQMVSLPKDKQQEVINWAFQEGLYTAWQPSCNHYDTAIVLGATTGHMQMRLLYLKMLWEEGVRFDEVVWLTGDRPLDPQIDGLIDVASNESEAAHILWMQADLPREMKSLPVRFIATAMYECDGQIKRPNTMDTLVTWLETAKPCRALFASTQPFCGYQYAIINDTLPESFDFDVVGAGGDPSSHPAAAAITLDAVARWLYQESLCQP